MSGTFGGIGVTVKQDSTSLTLTIASILPDSPAEKGGLQVGDIIYAINGKTVEELGYDKAGDYIKGDVGTEIQITVIRNEEYFTHTITRGQIIVTTVTYEIDPKSKIGYIAISGFKRNTPEQFKQAVDYMEKNNAVGIIFDLRNNLGGYVSSVTDMISYLLPSGNTVVSYQYKGESPTVLKTEDDGFNEDHVVDLPFVVISNKYTASASEIFTAAIRDYRNSGLVNATIVGTTTYGKGIIQNRYYYFDGSSLTMTIAYYYTPAKVNFHGTGITPDVIIDNGESDIDLQRNAAYVEMQKLLNAN
jgi:carboxyl-terminal processing protease